MEYKIKKEGKKSFKIYKRRTLLGIKFAWNELLGWQSFANDEGGWSVRLRFKSKKKAKEYIKTRGLVHLGGGFTTTVLPKGTKTL